MFLVYLFLVAAAANIVPYTPPSESAVVDDNIDVRGVTEYDVTVRTFVSSRHCGEACDQWAATLNTMRSNFPEFTFEVEDVDPEIMKSNTVVPSSVCSHRTSSFHHEFSKEMTPKNVRRWLLDCKRGFKTDVRTISMSDPTLSDDFPEFVHVLSPTYPSWGSVPVHRLPTVGFAWSNSSGGKFNNTIVTRNILGVVDMRFNVDKYWELLHFVLPVIIPYWMVETDTGNDVLYYLSKHQVYIFSDESLPPEWETFATGYPNTAFVQFRSKDAHKYWGTASFPSVATFEYGNEYVLPSIGPDVQGWLSSVWSMREEPLSRLSNLPTAPHAFLPDLSGATLWPWVREYNETFLYVFGHNESSCLGHFEEMSTNNPEMKFGRLNVTENSHETLWTLRNRENVVVQYVNGTVRSVVNCDDFELAVVSKLEL